MPVNRPEQGPRTTLLAFAGPAEVFGCSNPSGPEYPCPTPPRGQLLSPLYIRGTHLGGWRGLPATGRRVEFPLCGVYTFDADDRLAGEKIYYDRGTVLRQLGIFHEPQTVSGRISILATHPATIARALARKLLHK